MNRILIIYACWLFAACSSEPKVPEDLLQPNQMQAIMFDLIQADGVSSNALPTDSLAQRTQGRAKLYQQVLTLHGTNKETFVRSLKYYESKPSLLRVVLDSMDKKANQTFPGATAYGNRDTAVM